MSSNIVFTWIDINTKIFGVKIYDEDLIELLVRFAFNLLVTFILVYKIYHKHHGKAQYSFTFYIFNILIFFISYMMASVKLELGFAFGLFAIFSILRYRTDPLPIKEMTYLFIVITIAVINAITTEKVSYLELITTNTIIVFATYYVENLWFKEEYSKISIDYPSIEFIHTDKHEQLIEDLKKTTGLDIHHIDISSIDLEKGKIKVRIHYKSVNY